VFKKRKYAIELLTSRSAITRPALSNKAKSLQSDASKINRFRRYRNPVNGGRMRNDHFYVTNIRADGERIGSLARTFSAKVDQSLSTKVGDANAAQLLLQKLQGIGLGPLPAPSHILHVRNVEIDQVSERRRINLV